MEKPENIYINIELRKNVLDTVQKSFDYILQNHHAVDWAIPSIPHLYEVKAITDKIANFTIDNDNATVQIPMTKDEWIDYSCLIEYVGSVLPEDWVDDKILLEDLSFEYADLEDTCNSLPNRGDSR